MLCVPIYTGGTRQAKHEGTPTRRKNKRFSVSDKENDPIEIPKVKLISRTAEELAAALSKLPLSPTDELNRKLDGLKRKNTQRHQELLHKFEQIRALLVANRA